MKYFKKLEGKEAYLSPITLGDSENWSAWLNISKSQAEEKIRATQESPDKTFSMVNSDDHLAFGMVSLTEINPLYQNALINMTCAEEEYWTLKKTPEAIQLTLDYAFNCLNLHSLALWLPETESIKIECFKKASFKESARRRKSRRIGQSYVDDLYLDILSTEYDSIYVNEILEQMENK